MAVTEAAPTTVPRQVVPRPGLPPGPRAPKWLQTMIGWGPAGDATAIPLMHRRYGDAFTLRVFPLGAIVVLADPADVKRVFTGGAATFHAGEGNELLTPVLGARSVLVLDDHEHMQRRRLMLPMFHGEAIARFRDVIRSVADEEIDGWPLNEPFKLHRRTKALTFEAILRLVVGEQPPERMARFRAALPVLVDVGDAEMLMWAFPWLGRFGLWKRYGERQAHARALLREEIHLRRADPALSERHDILSLLVQARYEGGEPLDDDDLIDQLVTLLLAGHETTSTGLAWAFECLLRNPAVLRRARTAAHDGDDRYLDAVVQETLRLRPVIAMVVRKLTEPATVAGYELPAGVSVGPSIYLLHRDPRRYPEPSAFRPERFLDGGVESYAWIPFGGGTRRCLGAAFAQLEMREVIGAVLRRAELEPARARPDKPRTHNITVVPSHGVPVVCKARRPGSQLGEGN